METLGNQSVFSHSTFCVSPPLLHYGIFLVILFFFPSSHRQELVEQLQEAREEKKRLRKNLKEFEEQFFRQNGR